jgi:threonine-phosphate decarboxylase
VATARRHGIAPECLLDFSSNVNPYGPPPGARRWLARAVQDWALLRGYPDDGHSELRSAVARRWRVPSEAVVVGNGTSALLHEVVRLFTPRSYLLPEPAFSEYAHALRSVGARRIAFPLQAEKGFRLDPDAFAHALLRSHPSLAIVTNPHNPSGALTSGHGIDAIVEAGRRAGTLLLLDEAFIDYAGAGATRVVAAAAGAHLVVLRSLTKLYGMAGLRVGAAVSAPELAAPLRAALASWPVGALAAGAALEAVRDTGFAAQARERNARDRRLLARGLGCLGCRVFPSAANFLLLRLPEGSSSAGLLRERLVANHGILVRDASSYSGLEAGRFLRVAVRRRAENRRLLTALRRLLGEAPRC